MSNRFTVRKDVMALSGNSAKWIVWDNQQSEWTVARKTKRKALETAEDWNIAEEIAEKVYAGRRARFCLLQGGAA